MRLEFEPTVTALPLLEDQLFEYPARPDFAGMLKNGIQAAQNGERERAREFLSRASQMDPHSEDAWMWRASVSDYPEELLAFLDRVLDINPENVRAAQWRTQTKALLAKTFVQRAVAAHEEGAMETAVRCLDQALIYDYNCEMAWFWKASMAVSDDGKIECLRNVLEINPSNQGARDAMEALQAVSLLGNLEEAKSAAVAGKRNTALKLVDEFLLSVPNNAEAWILRSHLSLSIGDKVTSLERAIAIDPDNVAAKSNHAFLLETLASSKKEPVSSGRIIVIEPAAAAEPTTFDEPIIQELPEIPEITLSGEVEDTTPTLEFAESLYLHPSNSPVEPLSNLELQLKPVAVLAIVQETDELALEIPVEPNAQQVTFELDTLMAEKDVNPFLPKLGATGVACAYCESVNEAHAFECSACQAVLTLSDIESLLSNPRLNRELMQRAVIQMEAEWYLRKFNIDELTVLGIGHFNLGNSDAGLGYLREALNLDANNLILADQVNTLAIRVDEIRRQKANNESMPKAKTILVVDDSPTVRKLIAGKLEKSGHTVVCAVDGVEAMELIATSLPDLVLLDITMPRKDGYEVCKEIRSDPAAAGLPIVMISGKDGFFDKVRGRMAGATGYVTKPFGPETLMKALETYLVPDEQ